METLVTTLHFITAILMIILILMQQGKGASMGASLGGGASNTVFGSAGGATFFGKLTAFLAVVFFVSSLALTLFARSNAEIGEEALLPALETETPIEADQIPAVPALPLEGEEAVPSLPVEDQ